MLNWILAVIAVFFWITAYVWYFNKNVRQLLTRLFTRKAAK